MKILYKIVSNFFLLVSPLIILYRIVKGKEDTIRFLERYAIRSQKRTKGKLIWFHCSSVGELLSLVPLVEKIEKNPKINQILITSTTLSSSKIFNNLKLKKTTHQFFPIDNAFIIEKFVNYWKPSALFLCESEIWPNLIDHIHKKKINLVLINARMTLKSFKRWNKIKYFSKELFSKFNLCLAQNYETHKRLKLLGVKKIVSLGNLKFSTSKKVKTDILNPNLIKYFKQKKILITAASTHFNEENFIINNHLNFKKIKNFRNIISIIVPRHIERSAEIKEEVEKHSLNAHLHSSKNQIKKNIDVYIVDTYGELNKFYKISYLVFMGGSLVKHGGQNPLEPAKFGCKIIHGPYVSNFKEIYKSLGSMGVSKIFKKYKEGHKIVKGSLFKKRSVFENKKIIKYGEKILKLNYFEIKKFI